MSIESNIERLENGAISTRELAYLMKQIPLIEDWCKAVRARVEKELLSGAHVPGWKLVQGRKGSRSWQDEDAVVQEMKRMRFKKDQIYTFKLASPTQLEKTLKKHPRQWASLEKFVTQSEGSPSVAPDNDPRPALVVPNPLDDFDVV